MYVKNNEDAAAMRAMLSDKEIAYFNELQQAYEQEIAFHKSLLSQMKEMDQKRKNLLNGEVTAVLHGANYYTRPQISQKILADEIRKLRKFFVQAVLEAIIENHMIQLSMYSMGEDLLPTLSKNVKNFRANRRERKKYDAKMFSLSVSYDDVLAWVYHQLDGMSLSERAERDLRLRCHNAVTERYGGTLYERNGAVILLNHRFGVREDRMTGAWLLCADAVSVFEGLSFFETGSFRKSPKSIRRLAQDGKSGTNRISCGDCKKVKAVRLYRNGRIAISFTSQENAEAFEERFLMERRPAQATA